jgi:predicted small metal-binding protein
MNRQIKCECGYVARGATDDEAVAAIREHMKTDHPDVYAKVGEDEIRLWIEIVDQATGLNV